MHERSFRARFANVTLISLAAACAALFSAARSATAQSGPPPLPEEAFAACQSKSEGDACAVSFRDREIKGTCVKHPADARLVCRPSEPPPPPPEAFQACEGKKAADACTVPFPGHTMPGVCVEGREGKLVCAPSAR